MMENLKYKTLLNFILQMALGILFSFQFISALLGAAFFNYSSFKILGIIIIIFLIYFIIFYRKTFFLGSLFISFLYFIPKIYRLIVDQKLADTFFTEVNFFVYWVYDYMVDPEMPFHEEYGLYFAILLCFIVSLLYFF